MAGRIGTFLAVLVAAAPAGSLEAERSTPRAAVRTFIDGARAGAWDVAAGALDLSGLPAADRPAEGPRLARRLKLVLDRRLWIEWDRISDDPAGDPADGAATDLLGTLDGAAGPAPLLLEKQGKTWRFSRRTVAAIPALYQLHGAGPVVDWLPPMLTSLRLFEVEAWQWIGLLTVLLLAWPVASALSAGVAAVGRRVARRTEITWDDRLIPAVQGPARLLLSMAVVSGGGALLALAAPAQRTLDVVARTLVFAGITWLLLRLVGFLAATLEERLTAGVTEASLARGVRTQIGILRRVAAVVVLLVGGALVLMQIDVVRDLGTSLLASAGIAGVVIGLAAQKSIGTLLAGLQLSFTQPVRIGDTVVIESEFGHVEEITLTYVVVRVWDDRRLVVPITRFLEQPFQNWTKVSPELLGTIFVFADYTVPVERVRAELVQFVNGHSLWDRRACGLQVTDAGERTVTLRALVSASDASRAWDLRCAVREHLVGWLQATEGGRYLPRARVEAAGDATAVGVAA